MTKKNAATMIMNELLLCGGEWKTRKQLFDELIAEGHDRWLVDWYLFCLGQRQKQGREDAESV